MTEDTERALRGRRVVCFKPFPDFWTNPTLSSLADALERCGAKLDLVMPPPDEFPEGAQRLRRWPYPSSPADDRRPHDRSRRLSHRLSDITLSSLCRYRYYDLALGVDPEGIVTAHQYVSGGNTPLAYLSFEIFFEDELTAEERAEKRKERIAAKAASFVLTQDDRRAELLGQETGLDPSGMLRVPVAPATKPSASDRDWWRSRYGLASNQRIVLHSGSIANWTFVDELLDSVGRWGPGFALVLHSRTSYVPPEVLRRGDGRRVIVSDIPLQCDEYERLVASADIGLALYNPVGVDKWTGRNLEHIGLASGKLAFYMKYGLPAVTVRHRELGALLQDHGCGVSLESFDELPWALDAVVASYDQLSAAATGFFDEICFDAHWPKLLQAIAHAMATA
jgi:hypothetical protein